MIRIEFNQTEIEQLETERWQQPDARVQRRLHALYYKAIALIDSRPKSHPYVRMYLLPPLLQNDDFVIDESDGVTLYEVREGVDVYI